MRKIFPLLFLFLCACCEGNTDDGSIKLGQVSDLLVEASALTSSIANKGYLWTINDSGNPAEVYLIDSRAQIKMICKLKTASNRDWEDLAIGAGPDSTLKYLYVAEIGDNNAEFPFKYLYRFPEPVAGDSLQQTINNVEKLVIKMPDGKRDTETILIDPITNDFYLISKREENVHVYMSSYPYSRDTIRPEKVLTLLLTQIVSGSISPDAQQVLLKNYKKIYYWKRAGEKTLIELLAKVPQELTYSPENQGEAICWNLEGNGFYTLSESPEVGSRSQLRFYKRP